jgi:prephenate dehydrogenase
MESLREVKKICLIGVDEVVANLVVALRRTGFTGRTHAVAPTAQLRRAWDIGVANDGSENLEDGLRDAQLIVLSFTLKDSSQRLASILENADPGSIIVDLSHTKGYVPKIFEDSGREDVRYVGIRLIDSLEISEVLTRTDPFYFDSKTLILTPRGKADLDAYGLLSQALESIGAQVIALSPIAHDRLLANYVHLPRVMTLAVLEQVYANNSGDSLRPGIMGKDLVAQLEQLVDLHHSRWSEELEPVKKLVCEGIDLLVERLQLIKRDLTNKGLGERMNQLLANASLTLERAAEADEPRLVVIAEDNLKTLEKVSKLLANARLVINDLERADRPGAPAYKLTMKTNADRDDAVSLLKSAGIQAFDIQ